MDNFEKPWLIGLGGYAHSGKNTVADMLAELVPGTVQMAFADELKHELCDALGISRAELEMDKDRYYREPMQAWGMMRRKQDVDYWVRKAEARLYATLPQRPPLIAITDVRFPNEVAMLRAYEPSVYVRVIRRDVARPNDHESEIALDNVLPDCFIENHGTKDDLRQAVLGFYQRLTLRRIIMRPSTVHRAA